MINYHVAKYEAMQVKVLEQVNRKELKKKEAAEMFMTSRVTLNRRLNRFERFGVEGLRRKKRKKYPPASNRTPGWIEDEVSPWLKNCGLKE